jgi:hypothetical protein
MNRKKILAWVGLAVLVFFLISQPRQLATVVEDILRHIRTGFDAVIIFVSSLFA